MSTSGSYNYTQTAAQLIADALTSLGVIRPGGTVSSNDSTYCLNKLNKMVKAWEAQGIHMWKETEGTLFLRDGVNKYTLSASSSDSAGDNVVETTLTAAGSGTSLTVSSTVGMTTGDTIIIQLDDDTQQSTTITVNSATSLTLGTTLTSACSSGNRVGTYTTHATKPMMITSVRFNDSNNTDRPCFMKGRDEFMQIPDKAMTGKVNQVFYSQGIDSGTLYVWPTPDTVADRIKFSYLKQIEDFDATTDNADFPTEWLDCLELNLMARIAKAYGKDLQDRQLLQLEAQQSLQEMQLFDTDAGSMRVVPNFRFDDGV